MKKILVFVGLVLIYQYWHTGHLPLMKRPVAVDASGNPALLIFTYDGCGKVCDDAVKELQDRRVPFTEKRINPENDSDENVKLWKKYRDGDDHFPFMVAGKNSFAGFYKPEIASLLGKTFGEVYFTPLEKHFYQQHFNADGTPRIVLYGTSWCGYCAALRREFRVNKIDFLDVDVEKSSEQNLLCETLGINGYPATWVGYHRVRGSDLAAVKDAMKDL